MKNNIGLRKEYAGPSWSCRSMPSCLDDCLSLNIPTQVGRAAGVDRFCTKASTKFQLSSFKSRNIGYPEVRLLFSISCGNTFLLEKIVLAKVHHIGLLLADSGLGATNRESRITN